MPITPPGITSAIVAAGPDLKGPVWFRFAAAVGTAVAIWAIIPANVVLIGTANGGAGAGTVSGKIFIVPQPLPVNTAMASTGLLGFNAARMARAVGMGVANGFNTQGTYVGASALVGTGGDLSKITFANSAKLAQDILTVGAGQGLVGPLMGRLSVALGIGIANLLLTGTGVGTVQGPAGPVPTTGQSISWVL